MEPRDVITGLLAILAFIALYFVKPAKDEAKAAVNKADSVKDELNEYKLHVAEHYVTINALDKHFERMESQISELKEMVKRQ